MSIKAGVDCILSRNTGTYASPAWNLIDGCTDVKLEVSRKLAEIFRRAGGGWKEVVSVGRELKLTVTLPYDTADADFVALKAAFIANTTIEFAVADGAIGTAGTTGSGGVSGSHYIRFAGIITAMPLPEPTDGIVSVEFTIEPTPNADAVPAWATVS
jgi:hypothetical protein